MVLQNSSTENCPWLQRFRGAGTAPCWEGERVCAAKTPPAPAGCCPCHHLWSPLSPLQPHLCWGLGAEPCRACVDSTNSFSASGRQQRPRREGLGWGISRMWVHQLCVKVLPEFWDSDPPRAPSGSHSQGWLPSSWSHKRSLPPISAFDLNDPSKGIKQPKPTGLGFFKKSFNLKNNIRETCNFYWGRQSHRAQSKPHPWDSDTVPEPCPLLTSHFTQTGSSHSLCGALLGGDTGVTQIAHHPGSEKIPGMGGGTKVTFLCV